MAPSLETRVLMRKTTFDVSPSPSVWSIEQTNSRTSNIVIQDYYRTGSPTHYHCFVAHTLILFASDYNLRGFCQVNGLLDLSARVNDLEADELRRYERCYYY